MNKHVAYGQSTLVKPIRSRMLHDVNGLEMHILEAGYETANRPCIVLLHGFPELAYSWRHTLPALAAAGYHVVAPDQRGYGRTTGWDGNYDGDLASFRFLNLAKDILALVYTLGYHHVHGIVGHDFGSPVAALCALVRPDVFRRVALMSAPFGGPPALPFGEQRAAPSADVHADLANLAPPRKHYQWYYSTRAANADMHRCKQGVHDFLRAYYHHKSADWTENKPFALAAWAAAELAKLPTYYVMHLHETMAQTVAPHMPSSAAIDACQWLSDEALRVYSNEYERLGFQGGLQWYRQSTDPRRVAEQQIFAGLTIDQPACFIAGASDWGVYQRPGVFEAMQRHACTHMQAVHLIEGAGHWVQQEQAQAVNAALLEFFA